MRALLAGALAILMGAPAAAADPLTLLAPPQGVAATHGEGTVTLSWSHPDARNVTFHVYQDGFRVASTNETTIALPAAGSSIYFITAEDKSGVESAPSRAPWPWPINQYLPDCALTHTTVDLEFPFVHVVPNEACIEAWRRMVEGSVS